MSNSCNIYVRIFQLPDKQIAKGFRLDIVFHLLLLLSSSTSCSYINFFFFESTLSNWTNCVGIFLRETSSKFINLVMKFKNFPPEPVMWFEWWRLKALMLKIYLLIWRLLLCDISLSNLCLLYWWSPPQDAVYTIGHNRKIDI